VAGPYVAHSRFVMASPILRPSSTHTIAWLANEYFSHPTDGQLPRLLVSYSHESGGSTIRLRTVESTDRMYELAAANDPKAVAALPPSAPYRSSFAVGGHVVVMPTTPSWLEELDESCESGEITFDREKDVVVVILHDALRDDEIPPLLEQLVWALQKCRSKEEVALDEANTPFQLQLLAFKVGEHDTVLDVAIEPVPAGYASSDMRAASLVGGHCGADDLGKVIERVAASPATPRRQRLAPALEAVRRICAMVSTRQWLLTEFVPAEDATARRGGGSPTVTFSKRQVTINDALATQWEAAISQFGTFTKLMEDCPWEGENQHGWSPSTGCPNVIVLPNTLELPAAGDLADGGSVSAIHAFTLWAANATLLGLGAGESELAAAAAAVAALDDVIREEEDDSDDTVTDEADAAKEASAAVVKVKPQATRSRAAV
jgi:hypothetical protein